MFNIIPSEVLKIDDVPAVDADIHEISLFALTYDNAIGYINTNLNENLKIDDDFQYMSLIELRLVLFIEQRRYNHFGRPYPKELEQRIRDLIFEIRFRLEHE